MTFRVNDESYSPTVCLECVRETKSNIRVIIEGHMRLKDLQTHTEPYVTVSELAEYWLVGRKQIYKQIDAGTLRAIRLGPRLLRIKTTDAREFERLANMRPPKSAAQADFTHPLSNADRIRRAR
jgi:excisionase family DNA binding protein